MTDSQPPARPKRQTTRARRLLAPELVLIFVLLVATIVVGRDVRSHDPKPAKGTERVENCPAWKTTNVGNGILDLTRTASFCRATAVLRQWSPEQRRSEQAGIALDYWLIALYVATVGAACLEGRRWIRFSRGGTVIAVAQLVAGGFDVAENRLLEEMLSGHVTHYTAWWATVCFNAKIPIIATGVLFGAFAVGGRCRDLWRNETARPTPMPELPPPSFPAALELEHESVGRRLLNWLKGVRPEPVLGPPMRPAPVPGRAGICCSGGGIRSAAYNLGALQALTDANEYQTADYISAVSGGSYIAAAYAIVASHSQPGVIKPDRPPFHPGSPEEQFLRNHSSYLAPGVAGKLSLLWRVVRGLVVNLTLIMLLVTAVGLIGGWLVKDRMRFAGPPEGSVLTVEGRTGITLGRYASIEHEDFEGRIPLDEGSVVDIRSLQVVLRRGALVKAARERHFAGRLITRNQPPEELTKQPVGLDGAYGALVEGRFSERTGNALVVPTDATIHLGNGAVLRFDTDARPMLKVSRLSQVRRNGAIVELCRGGPCVAHDVPRWVLIVLFATVGGAVACGTLDVFLRSRWAWTRGVERWSVRFGVAAVAWFVLAIGLPETVEILLRNRSFPALDMGGVSGGGVLALIVGVLADLTGGRGRAAEAGAAGRVKVMTQKLVSRVGPRLRSAFVALIGGIVGPLLILTTFVLIVTQGAKDGATEGQILIVTAAGMGAFLMWSTGDLIQWSVYPLYKRRLWSAFVLRRYEEPPGTQHAEAVPDYDRPLRLGSLPEGGPRLVVCAAANVSTQGVAPPGRPVSTFTFERDAVGGGLFGALSPLEMESLADGEYAQYVTVASAFAISGAAVSPAMGKMTKRRFTFLMALANVRLGVWLPNPLRVRLLQRRSTAAFWRAVRKSTPGTTPPSSDVAQAASDREARLQRKEWVRHYVVRPHYLLMELLGWNSYRRRFIYVTDGGHFENLGLVELLRRGCTYIYCFDASGGDVNSYATLGEAVALARSELGVDIDIHPETMSRPNGEKYCANDHVAGTITFPGSTEPDGCIVFSRTAVISGAPWDVRSYAENDPAFPTHPTLDQLYTDEKFEAYRKLGNFTAQRAIETMRSRRGVEPERLR